METGSVDVSTTVPLSLAARAYHPRTLEALPGGEFYSLMRPKDDEWERVEDAALKVNKLTREELKEAPERDVVWASFVEFVKRFQKGKQLTGRPIPAGHNIKNFDLPIIERLCRHYRNVDKDGRQNLFHPRDCLDLKDILFLWYENTDALVNFKLDTVRAHFALSSEHAHRADVDVFQTGDLIIRFLKLHRKFFERCPSLKGVASQPKGVVMT